MRNKSWIKKLIISTLILFLVVISFNFIINPYGVFEIPDIKGFNDVKNRSISDTMSKFYYAKRANPEVLMIGTSRMEHLKPQDLAPYVDGKIYNLAIKGSGIKTQYDNIKYFTEKQHVHTIVLALDFFAFSPYNNDYTSHGKTRYQDYYINDYLDSLLSFRTLRKSFKTLKDSIKQKDKLLNKYTGWYDYKDHYKTIEKIGEKEYAKTIEAGFTNWANDKHFFGNPEFKKINSIDKGIQTLKNIITISKEKNIKLYIFIAPMHYKSLKIIYDRGYGQTHQYWETQISKLAQIYDFSYPNQITKNSASFIDTTHMKHKIGKLIFAKIFQNKNTKNHLDFGKIL